MLDISEVLVRLGGGGSGVLSIGLPPGWLWSFCSMVLMSKDLLLSGALSSLFWLLVGARNLNSHLSMFFIEALSLLSSVVPAFSLLAPCG